MQITWPIDVHPVCLYILLQFSFVIFFFVLLPLSTLKKKNNLEDVSVESKTNKAKTFLGEMKKSLSQVNFDQIIVALQSYKTTDSLEALLSKTLVLTEDANTHSLFRGM